ncbi:MAG: site-specific integrase, partial [archaeon]|nr:site-specific integrase [archaeon]
MILFAQIFVVLTKDVVYSIRQFLESRRSDNTKNQYRTGLRQFFIDFGGKELPVTDNEGNRGSVEDFDTSWWFENKSPEKYTEQLLNFIQWMKQKEILPNSRAAYVTSVRSYLFHNEIGFNEFQKKKINDALKAEGAELDVPTKKPFSYEILWRIFGCLPWSGKSYFGICASSGARSWSEPLQLRDEDTMLGLEPARVRFRGSTSKMRQENWAFISSEVKRATEIWLEIRGRIGHQLNGMLFGNLTKVELYHEWCVALHKSGYDQRNEYNGQFVFHPYKLRHWFIGRMTPELGNLEAHMLAGHAKAKLILSGTYDEDVVESLAPIYRECEKAVTLNLFSDTWNEYVPGPKIAREPLQPKIIEVIPKEVVPQNPLAQILPQ